MRTSNNCRRLAPLMVLTAVCLILFGVSDYFTIDAEEGNAGLAITKKVCLNEEAIESVKAKILSQTKLAAHNGKRKFSFVVLGDTQGYYDAAQKLLDQSSDSNPLFAIFLGDLTQYGTASEYERYVELVERNRDRIPIISLIGNHDIQNKGRSKYLSYFGKSDFFFDLQRVCFICLDNSAGKFTPTQIDWLRDVLKAADGRWKFIFMHEPPYIGNWWFRAFTEGTNEFLELVEKYKVTYVFAGHVHIYDELERNGVRYIVAGSGGVPPANLPIGEPMKCYVKVEVSKSDVKATVHRLEPE